MDVVSTSPLRTASILWQPRPDAFVLTVVCKATYLLQPDESPLAPEQDRPHEGDGYWNDDEAWSLATASDLAPFKRRADVLLTGHAFAAARQPVTSLVARVVVGGVDKQIEVHGDRWWRPDGRLTPATPFTRMSLRWERAAGGSWTGNPSGVSASVPPDARGLRQVPNLLPVGSMMRSPVDTILPVGFGPIAPTWPERAAKLHRHAASWRHHSWAERPLPDDIDAAYFNAAPPDQQIDQLLLDGRLVLEHLHPDHPHLVTTLAAVSPRAMVRRPGADPREVQLRCDTLCIDTDRGICTLLWRGAVPLRDRAESGVVVVTAEESGSVDEGPPTLTPWLATSAGSGGALAGAAAGGLKLGYVGAGVDHNKTMVPDAERPLRAPVLPFTPPQVQTPALPPVEAEDATLDVPPPTAPAPKAFNPRLTISVSPADPGDAEGTLVAWPIPAAAAVLPFRPAESSVASASASVALPTPPPIVVPPDASVWTPPRRDEPPAEPPWRRPPPPLALVAPEPEAVTREMPPIAIDTKARVPVAAPSPEPEKLPLDEYPIERCSAIAARIACRSDDIYAALEAEELRIERWQALHAHWLAEIRAEAGRGKKALLALYDAAYVAALEEERGPIREAEYAKLVIAAERGAEETSLQEMRLPRGSMMRIRRVWLARIMCDPKAAVAVRKAMREVAEG